MMLASILLKTYGVVLWDLHAPLAMACWLASLVSDALWARGINRDTTRPRLGCVRDVLAVNVSALLVGLALSVFFLEATMRWKDGLPVVAQIAAILFRVIHMPVSAFNGTLYASTMVGPLEFPVNLDSLAVLPPMLAAGFATIYLLTSADQWAKVVEGLVWIAAVFLCVTILRWVVSTGLFLYFCDFIGNETEELPIAPFLRPGLVAAIYLPFFLIAAVILQPQLASIAPRDRATGPRRILPSHPWAWLVLTVLLVTVIWEPKGERKSGTVLINTFHTQWSRTDRPYDRTWFGAQSGYNYACLKRLFERFYTVREARTRLTAEMLAEVSVLIIYVPDQAFTEDERRAIQAFVEHGGGLLLIGDHTNVFGSSSNLNGICSGFGFQFRDDVLFDIDEDFFQLLNLPRLRSPFLHGIDFFKFRGPGSIRPTSWTTRTIFHVGNAKSLRAIYSVNNFYPPPRDNPKMWTGEFCTSAAAHHGRGRVVAFDDSTIFSNFEIFYPGKYEYLLNTVEWLHHSDSLVGTPVRRLSMVGVLVLVAFLVVQTRTPRRLLGTIAACILAAALSWLGCAVAAQARADFPRPVRPMQFLFFASEPDDEAYVLRAFVTDAPFEKRYDVFIQWVLRNDMFTGFYVCGPRFGNKLHAMLDNADAVDTGLALIATRPDHLELLKKLGPGPMESAERLLLMFSSNLRWDDVRAALTEGGILSDPATLSEAEAAWPEGTARLTDGERRIALVFSSEKFSDQQMGYSEKITPTEAQMARYQEEYDLLDWLFGRPVTAPPPAAEIEEETESSGNSAAEEVPSEAAE